VELSELHLVNLVSEGDEPAFERLFKSYFKSLHAYAMVIVRDDILAEEAVQQVFFRIWEKKEQLKVHTSVKAFLYRAVYNECINYLNRRKHRSAYEDHMLKTGAGESYESALMRIERTELETQLQKAMDGLPPQCRNIFYMSRFGELKYREIAAELGLSVKTVEVQMGKALKILRAKLVDFLPLLLWLLTKFK